MKPRTSAELLEQTQEITDLILKAKKKAREETSTAPEPALTSKIDWPVSCTIGPGLEGAIAGGLRQRIKRMADLPWIRYF